jgi:hypothetical protein
MGPLLAFFSGGGAWRIVSTGLTVLTVKASGSFPAPLLSNQKNSGPHQQASGNTGRDDELGASSQVRMLRLGVSSMCTSLVAMPHACNAKAYAPTAERGFARQFPPQA